MTAQTQLSTDIPGVAGEHLARLDVIVENQIFTAADTGYAVIKVRPASCKKGSHAFVAAGITGEVRPEERLVLSGEWLQTKYGVQLKISEFETPDLSGGNILEFLTGRFVKGIGPKLGEAIFKKFGEDTARVFDQEPLRLLEVKGIKKAKYEKIIAEWNNVCGKRIALIEFQKMGLHAGIVRQIFARWANPAIAIEQIKRNPYLLAWEIRGAGFLTADAVAQKLGIPEDSQNRLAAGLLFPLHEAINEGHCFLLEDELYQRFCKLLGYKRREIFSDVLCRLEAEQHVELFIRADAKVCVYLPVLARDERIVAEGVKKRRGVRQFPGLPQKLAEYTRRSGLKLHEKQEQAVRMACENQRLIITGGPGTGKTTIIKGVLAMLRALRPNAKIALAAPTGRAAKRLSESTGYDASTIHRLLQYNPQEGFVRNTENPLEADIVIIDESSMADIRLARRLIDAMQDSTALILVGDVNQLPSVGPGSVLKDLIDCGQVPVVRLSHIYRQSEDSFISLNAQAILDGRFQDVNLSNKTRDFFFMGPKPTQVMPVDKHQEILNGIIRCYARLLEKGYAPTEIQVLSPMKEGLIGVNNLNTALQRKFNPHGEMVYQGREREFRQGDKVMQLVNNYEKEIFNGDQGVIAGKNSDGEILIRFEDGRVLPFAATDCSEIALAYCMTIHKAQGSESKAAIVVLAYAHYVMLSRSIFYTAVTRAKEICILAGEMTAMQAAVRNNKVAARNTNLAGLLKN